MMERYKKNKKERERDNWQISGLWSSVLNALEVSRCTKVTLYNNSFGFMLWVVYTLCVPRDNHETANDSDFYSYCPLALLKNQPPSRCLRQFSIITNTA